MADIPEDKLDFYREHFEIFDVNNDGVISIRELGTALRSLGFHMNEKELDDLYKEVESETNQYIDFNTFVNIIQSKMKDPYSQHDLEEAL